MRIRPVAVLCALLAACAAPAPAPRGPVALRLIAFNDFHGALERPGVARLATAIGELKAGHPDNVVVAAGDLVGASPLVSSLFMDEPTINALSEAGLEISSVGNHEFDHGRAELERMQSGGCSTPASCFDGPFAGARFRYLAANVVDAATGKPLFAPYVIREYEGVPVAFVGAVLRGTPQIVLASGVRGLRFLDEAQSVNALVPELRARGVEAIVLLIHEGGRHRGAFDDPSCPGFDGGILDVLARLDRAVDVVVSGHTHETYACRIGGRLVTSAGAHGRFVTAIDVAIDRSTRDVISADARNYPLEGSRFAPQPRLDAYVKRVAASMKDRAERVIASIDGQLTSAPNESGESALGDLVADSQLEAMRSEGAQVAFMNPGGLRQPLASRRADGAVTYADLHSVQPFGNALVAMTLTGAQLLAALEQQWRQAPGVRPRVLQVSEGFRYSWDGTRRSGERVLRGSVTIGGARLDERAAYRVVVNEFLAGGGDGFTIFTQGPERAGGPLDLDAFESHVKGRALRAAAPADRINRVR